MSERAQDVLDHIDDIVALLDEGDTYVTGTGQIVGRIHPETSDCREYGCPIHSPSDHSMVNFPTHWRGDRGLMERICPHGVGHPDPDHMAWVTRVKGGEFAYYEGIHGCDGCCGSCPGTLGLD